MNETRSTKAGLRTGARYAARGFHLIRQPKIRRFVVIPLLINIALFSLGIACVLWGVEYALDTLLPEWLNWLRYLLWPLAIVATLIVVFYGFSVIANIVAGPFNGLLAQAVERHLQGVSESPAFSWSAMAREMLRTLRAELRKLLYFAMWGLPCLILFVVPGINIVAAPVWFLFGAWMLALEYVDCPLGNHGAPFPIAKHKMQPRRRLALGFGGTLMGLTMIPIINFIAMPVGVAGATALYLEELAENSRN